MNEPQGQTTTADVRASCEALAEPRYELVPLKGMREAARALPAGATVTVTCSPRHGIEHTLDAAESLIANGFRVVPHVAARLVHTREHLQSILNRLATAGLQECFVVGGDSERPAGPFPGGVELLAAIATMAPRPALIGIPAYPEGHHRMDQATLDAALHAKVAHADYAVTQMCFEAEPVLTWLQRQHDLGLRLPVYAGLPGMIERRRLLSTAMRIGLGASTRALTRQPGMIGRLLNPNVYRADDLIWQLGPRMNEPLSGLAGFHIYTFNQVEQTRAWLEEIHTAYRHWHSLEDKKDTSAPQTPAEQSV